MTTSFNLLESGFDAPASKAAARPSTSRASDWTLATVAVLVADVRFSDVAVSSIFVVTV